MSFVTGPGLIRRWIRAAEHTLDSMRRRIRNAESFEATVLWELSRPDALSRKSPSALYTFGSYILVFNAFRLLTLHSYIYLGGGRRPYFVFNVMVGRMGGYVLHTPSYHTSKTSIKQARFGLLTFILIFFQQS